MIQKIKLIIKQLQDSGLPIIVLRDCISKLPSITYTFFVISGIIVVLGLIKKADALTGGVDISNALSFFGISGATYLGRKVINKNDKGTVEIPKE